MKNLLLPIPAVVVLFAACLPARADILFSDNFNTYPDGSLVGAPGSPWIHHSGTTTGQVDVVSGQVILTSAETEDVSALLTGEPYLPGSGTILYSSFTVSFSALPNAAGTYFAHFRDTSTAFRDRVWTSTSGAGAGSFRFGLRNASGTAVDIDYPADMALGTTYTLVTRLDVDNGTSTLWVNPTSELDASVTATDVSFGTNTVAFALRQNTGMGTLALDNVVVGTTFGDVVPEPSILALLGLGGLGLLAWQRRQARR